MQVDWHCYSVPYTLTHQQLDVRLAARTAAWPPMHAAGNAAASLPTRRTTPNRTSTINGRPVASSPGDAASVPECALATDHILTTRPHPEQGYRACLGVMRLAKGYGDERLEAACRRALVLETCSYKSIQPILKTKMNQQPLPDGEDVPRRAMPRHDNIRGTAYYARADRPAEEPA